jgi:hypothetical protein
MNLPLQMPVILALKVGANLHERPPHLTSTVCWGTLVHGMIGEGSSYDYMWPAGSG